MAYKDTSEAGLFDQDFTLESLSKMGKPLPKLKEILDFEQFRPILEPVFESANRKSNAGRKAFDPVFMMKVLVFRGVGMIRAKANIANARAEAKFTWIMPSASNVTVGNIAMTNLVCNMCRLVQIKKYHADWYTVN